MEFSTTKPIDVGFYFVKIDGELSVAQVLNGNMNMGSHLKVRFLIPIHDTLDKSHFDYSINHPWLDLVEWGNRIEVK